MHLRHEPRRSRRLPRRLRLEPLEERCLLSYSITDLGTLAGNAASGALGINNAGQVVGESGKYYGDGLPGDPDSMRHAFLWDPINGIQDLGTLGGAISCALGIDDGGQVVGWAWTAEPQQHAFLWDSSNGMQDLGTLAGGNDSTARGVNVPGQVVGDSNLPGISYHAFLWDSSNGIQDLGTLPGGLLSEASAINASGQVVGFSAYPTHAFLWDSSNGMQDLGVPSGGTGSGASGTNFSGQVVGTWYLAAGGQQAFLWDSIDGMQDLGTLPGLPRAYAWAIDDSGQVVGEAADELLQTPHAFLWDSANGMQDLNALIPPDSGWTLLQEARAINDAGQIVGVGINPDGQQHAFLLTPDDVSAPRGRARLAAVIDPAVIQVLTLLGSHGIAGVPSRVPLFPSAQASPVVPEAAPPVTAETTLPTRAGLIPPRASAERQAKDVLFAGHAKASLSLECPDGINATALDALALELAQSLA
jgi:probable HAF family extracellular repeat protein